MLVSIVIPVKNAAQTLHRTLESLNAQTSKDFEVIVVDGGSTDGTLKILADTSLHRLTVINFPGSGITAAVNRGISVARGDAVMPWLCADDYLDANFVNAVATTFAEEKCDFVFGNWRVVADGVIIKERRPEIKWARKIRYRMPMILSDTFVFGAKVLASVGPLDESLKYANDYDLVRRVVDAGYKGGYSTDAWYYYQAGGLSQARHLECALEVAKSAVGHGSHPLWTGYHFVIRYLSTKISFYLNACRRLLRRNQKM